MKVAARRMGLPDSGRKRRMESIYGRDEPNGSRSIIGMESFERRIQEGRSRTSKLVTFTPSGENVPKLRVKLLKID